nr:MAG TPA: hypothetical protein [Bacteriophage sp.]
MYINTKFHIAIILSVRPLTVLSWCRKRSPLSRLLYTSRHKNRSKR